MYVRAFPALSEASIRLLELVVVDEISLTVVALKRSLEYSAIFLIRPANHGSGIRHDGLNGPALRSSTCFVAEEEIGCLSGLQKNKEIRPLTRQFWPGKTRFSRYEWVEMG